MPRLSKIGAAALAAFGWTGLQSVNVDFLVIAGGAGGGAAGGGGGGGGAAGGFRTGTLSLTPTLSYTVTVGGGGAAGVTGQSGATGDGTMRSVIQYFLPLLLLAVAVAVLVVLIVLEKQVALAAVAVTVGALVALEIHPQHLQAKATMVEHLLADIMVVAVVAVLLP
jgi:hypothetical protein